MPGRKPIAQCTDSEWRAIVTRLRAVCPPPEGYSIRFVRSAKCEGYGDCLVDHEKKRIVIRVERGHEPGFTEWIAIHELAHALDWSPAHAHYTDHGPTWGVRQAQVYCAFFGERH